MKEKRRNDNPKSRLWTFHQANEAVPLVRSTLRELRESYVRIWHVYRNNGNRPVGGLYDDELAALGQRMRELFKECRRIGFLPYDSPHRGIALFPFFVCYEDARGRSTPREAYFVYKDSRESVETYIFNDELCIYNDLFGWERPVPGKWQPAGARAVLDYTELT